MPAKKFIETLCFSLFVFGFAGWLYIVLNSEFHPYTLHLQLTHFANWPHEDTFGEMCFAISFISFFVWQLLRNESKE